MKGKKEFTELGVSTARGGAAFVTSSVLRGIIIVVLLIILAQLLKPEDFGFYTIVIAFYSILETGSYLGIGTALRKKIPEAKSVGEKVRIISNGLLASMLMGLALAAVLLLFSGYIATSLYRNASLALPIDIGALSILISLMFNVGNSSLLGLMRDKEASIANVLYSVVYLIASPALVIAGYGVAGAVAGLFVGYLVAFIVCFAYLAKFIRFRIVKPTKRLIYQIVNFSIPVFVSNTGTQLAYNFGIILLGIYASAVIVGNYGAAYKLGSFVDVILTAAGAVLLPSFSKIFSSKGMSKGIEEAYNGSLYYTLLFLLPLVAYVISVEHPLINLLFPGYPLAPFFFSVVVSGITLGVIGRYAGVLIIGHGDVKRFMLYQVFVVAVEVILSLYLIPYYKTMGLLVAIFIVGPLLLDFIYIRLLLERFSFRLELAKLFRVLLAAIILCLMLAFFATMLHQGKLALVVNAAIALAAYPAIVSLLRGVDRKNLRFILVVGSKVKVVEPIVKKIVQYAQLFVSD